MNSVQHHQTIAKYQLIERLGRGGSAEVWKAYDRSLDRHVALKILHPADPYDVTFRDRFVLEARVVARLNHPNIVQVYNFSGGSRASGPCDGGEQDFAYMVMQYIEGQTLADYLRKTSLVGVFPPPGDFVALFAAIADAIDYAHARGVIHRDIKPSNILLDRWNTLHHPMGEPVLTDFGMVKLRGHVETLAREGTVVGTPLYIPPEQAQGLEVSNRSDIYSLGVILYEAFTGIHPYTNLHQRRSGHTIAFLLQHIYLTPRHPSEVNPDVPPACGEVILHSLAKDPADRFSSASELIAALAESLALPLPDQLDRPDYNPEQRAGLQGVAFEQVASPDTPIPESVWPRRPGQPPVPPSGWGSLRKGGRSRLPLLIASLLLLIVTVLGVGLSAGAGTKSLTHGRTSTPVFSGTVSFLSSGRGDPTRNQGINDVVQIDLQHVGRPAAGTSDYAWLLGDANVSDEQTLLLGSLTVRVQGQATLTYRSGAPYTDLLVSFSRFLVTAESSQVLPVVPSLDTANWRYAGSISQQPNPQDRNGLSMLDHLRHLLAADPEINALGLDGGLSYWLTTNAAQVRTLATGARAAWNGQNTIHLHREVVRVLDYLDGSTAVAADLPPGTPLLVDPHFARVGLLEVNPATDEPPGYIYHIASHLQGLDASPGRTSAQHALDLRIASALDGVRQELELARLDAKQLVQMSDTQLLLPSTRVLLDDLVKQTTQALWGTLTASTHLTAGVFWIHANLQSLAVIQVFPHSPHQ
jgi:serine/threonine protein kinase